MSGHETVIVEMILGQSPEEKKPEFSYKKNSLRSYKELSWLAAISVAERAERAKQEWKFGIFCPE